MLSKLLPISEEDRNLIDWARGLEPDDAFHEQTKLKQELITLLRGFGNEIDKITTVRGRLGLTQSLKEEEPEGWRAVAKEEFPDLSLPETWARLSSRVKSHIEKRISEPLGWQDAARRIYDDPILPEFFDQLSGSAAREVLQALKTSEKEKQNV